MIFWITLGGLGQGPGSHVWVGAVGGGDTCSSAAVAAVSLFALPGSAAQAKCRTVAPGQALQDSPGGLPLIQLRAWRLCASFLGPETAVSGSSGWDVTANGSGAMG